MADRHHLSDDRSSTVEESLALTRELLARSRVTIEAINSRLAGAEREADPPVDPQADMTEQPPLPQ